MVLSKQVVNVMVRGGDVCVPLQPLLEERRSIHFAPKACWRAGVQLRMDRSHVSSQEEVHQMICLHNFLLKPVTAKTKRLDAKGRIAPSSDEDSSVGSNIVGKMGLLPDHLLITPDLVV